MHDSTIDEFTSEAIRENLSEDVIKNLTIKNNMSIDDVKIGLWPVIDILLKNNSNWILHERFTNYIKEDMTLKKIIDYFTFYNQNKDLFEKFKLFESLHRPRRLIGEIFYYNLT